MEMETVSFLGCAEPVASFSHFLGAAVALAVGPGLWRLGRTRGERRALGIFVFSVVFLLSMSGTYHLLEWETEGRAVLRRLDHAGIWLLIAGTFTPVHVICFRGFLRWGILGVIWTVALTGLVLKTVFFAHFPETLGLFLYIGLGWTGLIGATALTLRHGFSAVVPLLSGGVVYTVGGAVSIFANGPLLDGVIGNHEVFHAAVLAAIALHWRFTRGLVDPQLESLLWAPRPQGAGLKSIV